MLITLVDDSIPFSGVSPAVDPLGGAEKAFASLPAAIARRGHVVRAINRTPAAAALDNVSWLPWNGYRPAITEILIAYRKPSLLDFVRATKRKIFWFTQPADFLLKAPVDQMISRAEPQLVFLGRTHRKSYGAEPPAFAKDIPFGVGAEFLECEPMAPLNPPTAIVTTHPLQGLDWLIDLWTERIQSSAPGAELHVFSASFAAADQGAEIREALRPIYAKAKAAREKGVRLFEPMADRAMAERYRGARVHLYPGAETEMHCSTLAESQACGLPSVARPLGATAERIIDGETGFIAADDESFARHAVAMLTDEAAFQKVSVQARLRQRNRSWDKVAGEFEVLFR